MDRQTSVAAVPVQLFFRDTSSLIQGLFDVANTWNAANRDGIRKVPDPALLNSLSTLKVIDLPAPTWVRGNNTLAKSAFTALSTTTIPSNLISCGA